MTRVLHIEVDDELLLAMNAEPEQFAKDVRLAAAVKWYEMGVLSQEKAARMAGMSRAEFIFSLSRFRVSPFQESPQEVVKALEDT